MLGRKNKRPFHVRLWQFAPPRSLRKFRRELMYHWHRLNRIKGSTRQIALGFALGAGVSMTPFIGIHMLIGGALALMTRSSLLAMLLASILFGNPWTFPLIFWSSNLIGSLFIDISQFNTTESSLLSASVVLFNSVIQMMFGRLAIWDFLIVLQDFFIFLLPFMVGSLPLAIFMFLLVFYLTEEAIVVYHTNRMNRLRHRTPPRTGGKR